MRGNEMMSWGQRERDIQRSDRSTQKEEASPFFFFFPPRRLRQNLRCSKLPIHAEHCGKVTVCECEGRWESLPPPRVTFKMYCCLFWSSVTFSCRWASVHFETENLRLAGSTQVTHSRPAGTQAGTHHLQVTRLTPAEVYIWTMPSPLCAYVHCRVLC